MKHIQELSKNEKSGLPNDLKKGSSVKRGDQIAFVGQLYVDNGTKPFENTMLHFEKYNNKASGPFSLPDKTDISGYINVEKKQYKRRIDLENPTDFLDNCKLEN
jgi:murein DD-endopeptidase MepM/ murein hydrolase activator NlpD